MINTYRAGFTLRHPWTAGVDIEKSDTLSLHRRLIESKPLLRRVYDQWYRLLSEISDRAVSGIRIELGCGASFFDRYLPGLVKTDVVDHSNVEQVISATHLPFEAQSVGGIFIVDVLHHLEEPRKFFDEAVRCLKVGGRLGIIEPSGSAFNRWVFGRFHPTEYWDETISEWCNRNGGRLTGANMALSSVIFERDCDRFERDYPGLRVVEIRRFGFLAYALSGGLSFRAFVPRTVTATVWAIDSWIGRSFPSIATWLIVELERVGEFIPTPTISADTAAETPPLTGTLSS